MINNDMLFAKTNKNYRLYDNCRNLFGFFSLWMFYLWLLPTVANVTFAIKAYWYFMSAILSIWIYNKNNLLAYEYNNR